MRNLLLLPLLLLTVAACGESKKPDLHPADTQPPGPSSPMPEPPPPAPPLDSAAASKNFEHVVFMHFAQLATSVPRSVLDTVGIGNGPPPKDIPAMKKVMEQK